MKLLSKILLILNPTCGCLMVALIITSMVHHNYYWLLDFPLILVVVLVLKFYFDQQPTCLTRKVLIEKYKKPLP